LLVLRVAKALADPTRLRIWMGLGRHSWAVTAIAQHFCIANATASHHVARLAEAELVKVTADGRYRMVQRAPGPVAVFERLLATRRRCAPT